MIIPSNITNHIAVAISVQTNHTFLKIVQLNGTPVYWDDVRLTAPPKGMTILILRVMRSKGEVVKLFYWSLVTYTAYSEIWSLHLTHL